MMSMALPPINLISPLLRPEQIRLDPLRKFLRSIEAIPKTTYAIDGDKVFVFEKLVSLMSQHPLFKSYRHPIDQPRDDDDYRRLVNTSLVLLRHAWIDASEAVTIWGIQPNGYRIESTSPDHSVFYLRHQRLSVALPVAFTSLANAQAALACLLLGQPVTINLPGARYLTEDDLFVFSIQAANVPRTVFHKHSPKQPLVLLAEYTADQLPPLPELPAIARVHFRDRAYDEIPGYLRDESSVSLLSQSERSALIVAEQRWRKATQAIVECAQFNRQACIAALTTNQSTQALRAHHAATNDFADLNGHDIDPIKHAGRIIATCPTEEDCFLAGATFAVALLAHTDSASSMAWAIRFLQHGKILQMRLDQVRQLTASQPDFETGPLPIVIIEDLPAS